MAQCAVILSNAQSYDSCAVIAFTQYMFHVLIGMTDIIEFICILSMTNND